MANKTLFKNTKTSPVADTFNAAGGKAYKSTNEHALAQYACTGTFNDTYYKSGADQLKTAQELAETVNSTFIARLAIYARKNGYMKDMPAFLLAILNARQESTLLRQVFPRVVNTGRMLRTFVQIVRSGVTGRKNFGSTARNLINEFITSRDNTEIFNDSIGNNPSMADILRMLHTCPKTPSQEALFGYILGSEKTKKRNLPAIVKQFEALKAGDSKEIPDVNMLMLTNLNLTAAQWKEKAVQLPWNSLRMSLVSLNNKGVFTPANSPVVNQLAETLADAEQVRRSKAFPYSIYLAYRQAAGIMPAKIVAALHSAMEASVLNVPTFDGRVLVALDTSGSMGGAVISNKAIAGFNNPATCAEVGALFATAIARRNDSSTVGFDTSVRKLNIDPADSIITNTKKIALPGGGTDVAAPLRHWNALKEKANLIIIISDNESWFNGSGYYGSATSAQVEWEAFKKRNPNAAIVCINLTASDATQIAQDKSVLNVGGFSDNIFNTIKSFLLTRNDKDFWVKEINGVSLD